MAKSGIVLYEGGQWDSITTITQSIDATFTTTYEETLNSFLRYEYSTLCTNFDHAPGGLAFSGKARLQGHAVVYGAMFETLGPAPELTLTLLLGSYDPTMSAAVLYLSAASIPHTMYPTFTRTFSAFDAVLTASAQFSDADTAKGMLTAVMTSGLSQVGEGEAPFTLTRGGICPV